jgi:hypothetical protein
MLENTTAVRHENLTDTHNPVRIPLNESFTPTTLVLGAGISTEAECSSTWPL